jgi:hypothetical protein
VQLRPWILAFAAIMRSAYGQNADSKNTADGHLLWGDCQLDWNPEAKTSLWPVVCVNASAQSELMLNISQNSGNTRGLFGRSYAGIHFGKWLSWHLLSEAHRLTPLTGNESTVAESIATPENYALFGNQSLDHVRVMIGKALLAYGLDHDVLAETIKISIRDRQYWQFPKYSVRFTYDNLLDTIAEFSIGSDRISNKLSSSPGIEELTKTDSSASSEQFLSARISHDISALGGTRLMLFILRSDQNDTRYGAAMLNSSRRGSATSIEWQRRYPNDDSQANVHQLFRFAYLGPLERRQRVSFEYEDNRTRYWLLNIGNDIQVADYCYAKLGLGYYSREYGDLGSHFYMNLGAQVSL